MKTILKLVISFSLLTTSLFAGTIDPNTPDERYIEFGKKFHYVYRICGTYEDDTKFCASSVAIHPNWVLTAAHVVKNAKNGVIKNDEQSFNIIEIIVHKDYEENNYGEYDIALCKADKDLGLSFYPELYEASDEVGKLCTISGYGLTGTFITGSKFADNKKRAGSNKIEYAERDLLICTPSRLDKTALEFIICHGDSGGGLFIGNKLAGINSCVTSTDKGPDSTYGDESGYTRVSKFVSWIRKNMSRDR